MRINSSPEGKNPDRPDQPGSLAVDGFRRGTLIPCAQFTTATDRRLSRARFLLISLFVIFGISLAATWVSNSLGGAQSNVGVPATKRDRAQTLAACQQHVQEANRRAADAMSRRAAQLSSFIQSRKPGAKPFSEAIVSLHGKWRAVMPYLPFTDKDGHRKFVAEKFDQHLFTTADLTSAVGQSIEGSVKDLEEIENILAIALHQEVIGRSLAPGEIPLANAAFRKGVSRIVDASRLDSAKFAGNLVAAELAARMASQVLVRIGVSRGILAAGAASSWWSLGAGLAVGLVVDLAWEMLDDPRGEIERETLAVLDLLSSQTSTAILGEMMNVVSERTLLWTKTAEGIVP